MLPKVPRYARNHLCLIKAKTIAICSKPKTSEVKFYWCNNKRPTTTEMQAEHAPYKTRVQKGSSFEHYLLFIYHLNITFIYLSFTCFARFLFVVCVYPCQFHSYYTSFVQKGFGRFFSSLYYKRFSFVGFLHQKNLT